MKTTIRIFRYLLSLGLLAMAFSPGMAQKMNNFNILSTNYLVKYLEGNDQYHKYEIADLNTNTFLYKQHLKQKPDFEARTYSFTNHSYTISPPLFLSKLSAVNQYSFPIKLVENKHRAYLMLQRLKYIRDKTYLNTL